MPDDAGCCAFAGDRGMLHKELTDTATAGEAAEVNSRHYDAYLSASRMCEIGMERATGHPYRSALIALERATRPPLRWASKSPGPAQVDGPDWFDQSGPSHARKKSPWFGDESPIGSLAHHQPHRPGSLPRPGPGPRTPVRDRTHSRTVRTPTPHLEAR